MRMLKLALACAGALMLAHGAAAQNFPSGYLQANAQAGAHPPKAVSAGAWIDRWCGATSGYVIYRDVEGWKCASPGATSGVQPYDADLAAIAGVGSAAGKVPYFTGAAAADVAESTVYGRSLWNAADAGALQTLAALVPGVDVQAYSSHLAAIDTAGAPSDDRIFVGSGMDAGDWKVIPNCADVGGNHLNYTQSTNSFSCGTSSSGGGGGGLDGAFGYRNRLVNPSGVIWQVQNSGAAAVTDGAYVFDQWYGLTQSAGVTASQITNVEDGTPAMMRIMQANSTAQRMGLCQVIESANILDARGQNVTLSARVRMSASGNLRFAIGEWTGAADAPTKDVVSNWTSTTYTPGSFFIGTTTAISGIDSEALTADTLTSISLTATVGASMNNLWVCFWTESAVAQNVTLDVGKVQLELASAATPLAVRSMREEIALAERYYEKSYNLNVAPGTATTDGIGVFSVASAANGKPFGAVRMRVPKVKAPTISTWSANGTPTQGNNGDGTDLSANSCVGVMIGTSQFALENNRGSDTSPTGNSLQCHWVADGRI